MTQGLVRPLRWRGSFSPTDRVLPEESPVAVVINGTTQAVMMATPADLEDFALGFTLTEGLVASPAEIESLEVIEFDEGIEARLWVGEDRAATLAARRRHMAGPTGCGLCGIESLTEAVRTPPQVVSNFRLTPADIDLALRSLDDSQPLNAMTHAVHAAALWSPTAGLIAVREDVGRHNALDKLVGAARRTAIDTSEAALILTSRVSIEMVQKAAVLGAPILIAVSAPTSTARDLADEVGLTLVAIARRDGFELFTHPERIAGASSPKEQLANPPPETALERGPVEA